MSKQVTLADNNASSAGGSARPSITSRTVIESALPWVAVVAFLLVWQLAAGSIANAALLPPPARVASALGEHIADGQLLNNAVASLGRLAMGFIIAVVVGAPLGVLMALSRAANDFIEPVVEIIRPISGIAWIPLALIVLGVSQALPVFIIAYVAIFPIMLNTAAACRGVSQGLLRAARVLGLSRSAIIRHVVLPAAVVGVMTGARLGAGGAWLALVAAEFIGAPDGLGFSIWYFAGIIQTAEMIAYICVTGFGGYVTDRALRLLQRRLTPWSPALRGI
ncbi:ABC transporter permease [Jiangella asiatica]|uniref:ABC transporter permease n=1 Tax=Jiangella asiatica TaxID=2530372 RepID=A0A4V2Z431_9ACTN|nr:ABC transporter permease [Jiangella asiatica]TDE14988.1 ABC transporter permease [Jiangella asiatica]